MRGRGQALHKQGYRREDQYTSFTIETLGMSTRLTHGCSQPRDLVFVDLLLRAHPTSLQLRRRHPQPSILPPRLSPAGAGLLRRFYSASLFLYVQKQVVRMDRLLLKMKVGDEGKCEEDVVVMGRELKEQSRVHRQEKDSASCTRLSMSMLRLPS